LHYEARLARAFFSGGAAGLLGLRVPLGVCQVLARLGSLSPLVGSGARLCKRHPAFVGLPESVAAATDAGSMPPTWAVTPVITLAARGLGLNFFI